MLHIMHQHLFASIALLLFRFLKNEAHTRDVSVEDGHLLEHHDP